MRRGRGAVLLTALALAVPLAGIELAPPALAANCGTFAAPGFHAFSTKTRHYSCRRARKTIVSWLKNDARPRSGPRGWHCKKSYTGRMRCTRRRAVITFIFHAY
jgi:hypothetical protein